MTIGMIRKTVETAIDCQNEKYIHPLGTLNTIISLTIISHWHNVPFNNFLCEIAFHWWQTKELPIKLQNMMRWFDRLLWSIIEKPHEINSRFYFKKSINQINSAQFVLLLWQNVRHFYGRLRHSPRTNINIFHCAITVVIGWSYSITMYAYLNCN